MRLSSLLILPFFSLLCCCLAVAVAGGSGGSRDFISDRLGGGIGQLMSIFWDKVLGKGKDAYGGRGHQHGHHHHHSRGKNKGSRGRGGKGKSGGGGFGLLSQLGGGGWGWGGGGGKGHHGGGKGGHGGGHATFGPGGRDFISKKYGPHRYVNYPRRYGYGGNPYTKNRSNYPGHIPEEKGVGRYYFLGRIAPDAGEEEAGR